MRLIHLAALAALFAAGPLAPGVALAADAPSGKWLALSISGKTLSAEPRSLLEIAADGAVSGTGGCNRIVGRARIEGSKISFGALGGTMMMCEPAKMERERKFLAALDTVRTWHVAGKGRRLVFDDKAGKTVMVLVPQ